MSSEPLQTGTGSKPITIFFKIFPSSLWELQMEKSVTKVPSCTVISSSSCQKLHFMILFIYCLCEIFMYHLCVHLSWSSILETLKSVSNKLKAATSTLIWLCRKLIPHCSSIKATHKLVYNSLIFPVLHCQQSCVFLMWEQGTSSYMVWLKVVHH